MPKVPIALLAAQPRSRLDNAPCAECGMLVEPATAFHPLLYCCLFKAGFTDPAGFLQGQRFIPDPAYWGEGAPARQSAAVRA